MKDTTSVYVSEILTPAELQELSKKHLNLDELNYLAKRMDSFSTMEMEQFYAAMAQQGLEDLKSLINLTFNLDKFTLIQDISSAFAKCVDMKDAYTNGHSTRVAHYTALLAARLGKSQEEVDKIYNIALLHDIGKISIPDNILNKPGKLTDEEYLVMKSHPSRGLNILQDVSIAPELALGAGYHHEKYDGTGYPSGKKGDEIPQVAQIIAVADTFDAMYSTRPYRKKMTIEAVAAELRRVAGKQLNPDYVELFLQLIQEGEVEKIDKAYTTEPAVNAPEGEAQPETK